MAEPLGYFITSSCYGCRLHGDAPYSVDRQHATVDGPFVEPSEQLRAASARAMTQEPYKLDGIRRGLVLESVHEVCRHRGWLLVVVHVRSTHVHLIVQAAGYAPERVITTFKSYASRALSRAKLDPGGRKRWTRHGSTRYLNTHQDLLEAVRYVKEEQGDPMELWLNEELNLIP